MKLHITIIGFERPAQTDALIESFLKYKKGDIGVTFNVLYSNYTHEWAIRDAFQKLIGKRRDIEFTLVNLNEGNSTYHVEDYFKTEILNLVLPGNTLFTREFNLNDLYYLDFNNEYFNLFCGLNKVQGSEGTFYNVASLLNKRDNLYYYTEKPELIDKVDLYGKIFKADSRKFEDKLQLFYGISPCFISNLNRVEYVDQYKDSGDTQYSLYTMGLRYLMGETINIGKLDSYCSNRIYDNTNLTFKIKFEGKKVNNLVDQVYYINLNRRHDRRELIDKELVSHGITAERQEGIETTPLQLEDYLKLHPEFNDHDKNLASSRLGCAYSHLEIIKKAKERNQECVLILEDDCAFLESPHELLDKAFNDLNHQPPCDILYLGANVLADINRVSPNLGKINGSYCAHAYVVFKKAYDHILNFNWKDYRAIDELYMNMSRDSRFNVYTVLPVLAIQRPSYSDIEQKEVNYSNVILDSYKTHLK